MLHRLKRLQQVAGQTRHSRVDDLHADGRQMPQADFHGRQIEVIDRSILKRCLAFGHHMPISLHACCVDGPACEPGAVWPASPCVLVDSPLRLDSQTSCRTRWAQNRGATWRDQGDCRGQRMQRQAAGGFSEPLAARFGARVIATDPSEMMLDQARRKRAIGSAVWFRAAAQALPFLDGCASRCRRGGRDFSATRRMSHRGCRHWRSRVR